MSDTLDATQLLTTARAREAARPAPQRIDYDALNKQHRKNKAALTRAVNTKDRDKVLVACATAVRSWNQPGAMWPDDWSRWQRALDDAFPIFQAPDLRDLG